MLETSAPEQVALRRIADYEATIRQRWTNRLLRVIGQTRLFAFVYSRIGPRLDIWLTRRFNGKVASQILGVPSLLLVTTGAKSGLPRTSPLLYVRDGTDFLVVGTNFGQLAHPAWTGNLLANPRATIRVGAEELPVTGSLMSEAEFARYWEKFVAIYPGYRGYLERCGRSPRMFRLRS